MLAFPSSMTPLYVSGSSSIGTSVNAQFLAAFSAAAGKRSQHVFDSEESDPEVTYLFLFLDYYLSQ